MIMRHLAPALLFLLTGCGSIFGPDENRVVGVVVGITEVAAPIKLPGNARVGEEVPLIIYTAWHNGCARKGTLEIESEGESVTVTPYDFVSEGLCTQQVQVFTHTASLRFDTPGTVEVTIRGRPSRHVGVSETQRIIVIQ